MSLGHTFCLAIRVQRDTRAMQCIFCFRSLSKFAAFLNAGITGWAERGRLSRLRSENSDVPRKASKVDKK